MKAFQLKMVINGSKPPIWRRVVVPAGITFSQLSMILNRVMGWSGYHLFEFEFYHLELRIMEDAEEYGGGYDVYDYLEASDTFVSEYLEDNDWFTYIYDLGDDWKHRVTVEKILDDYEYNYPQVLKYKGNCPPEDCGGIDGYYECLAAIEDENNPEREERLEWLEMQGYPDDYDMDWVNRSLQENYFYKWGKGEKRTQRELHEDFFSGKYGLNATRNDQNKNKEIIRSGRHRMEAAMEAFTETFRSRFQWDMALTYTTLKDILDDFEREQIIEIIRDKGISDTPKGNKTTLIKQLVEHMLKPEVMEQYFLCLADDEIEVFERAAMTAGRYDGPDTDDLTLLYEGCYIGELEDDSVVVPRDVWNVYRNFKNEAFDKRRRQMSHVLCCLRASEVLYGIVPFHVLGKLVNMHPELNMSVKEIRQCMDQIPPEYNEFIVEGDKVYSDSLYPDDRGLLEAQGDKKYYIPAMEELIALGHYGCVMESKEREALAKILHSKLKADDRMATFASVIIQTHIAAGASVQEALDLLEDFDIQIKNKRQIEDLMKAVFELWNNTRMILNRGFTPLELVEADKTPPAPVARKDNIIDFQEAKKQKTYPNDPCPCGSGKKYKNCCKNKK